MNKLSLICIAIVVLSVACQQQKAKEATNEGSANTEKVVRGKDKPVQRFGMVTGLKPEKEDYYRKLHAAAWPAVLEKIKECNIRNYSIYFKNIEGKLYLFSYFEYAGSDFDADMKKMAADTTTQRWWKETDPCQAPLPDAASKGEIWSGMEEVFHTE